MTIPSHMFAQRTQWDLGENPLALELDKLRAAGVSVLDLTESNPTKAGIAHPADLILPPFQNTANLLYDPHPKGMQKAREAVARYYADKGIVVSPEQIILTSASSEAYTFLFRLLMNPHDRVLLPVPGYPLFSYLAGLNDVETANYRLAFDGQSWGIDFEFLKKEARRGVKAVVLVSPNNPTGSCVRPDEISRLNALCADFDMALISDEVFADYVFDPVKTPCPSLAANTGALSFALGGLSKAMALPQMKLGWIVVNGPQDQVHEAISRLEIIADTYLSVNTPVQNAAPVWLAKRGEITARIMARIRANYVYLSAAVATTPINVLPTDAGWYAVLQTDMGLPGDEWALRLLKEKHVFVHPGFFFDFEQEDHFVVSLLPPENIFQEGVRRVVDF